MAWTVTSVGIATPSTTSPLTITYNGGVGNLYNLFLSRDAAGDPFTTVTDDESNTWQKHTHAPISGGVGRRVEWWTCEPTTDFTSISIGFTGTSTAQATLIEVSGHNPSSFVNQVNSGVRSNSTAPEGFGVTPTVDNALIFAVVQANNNTDAQVTGPGTGWTRLTTHSRGPSIAYRTDIASGDTIVPVWEFAIGVGSGHITCAIAPFGDVPTGPGIFVWNGSEEVPAYLEGIYNGSEIVPATFDQIT